MEGQIRSPKSFIEDLEKNPYETIFIIGNGIIENGWDAFNEAVSNVTGIKNIHQAPIHPFAYLTTFLRFLSSEKEVIGTEEYKQRLELLKLIRISLSETFKRFQMNGKIGLKSGEDYVEKYKSGRTLLVTTNYDTLLGEYYAYAYNTIYLHGNCEMPNSIYLHTETSDEPYHDPQDRDVKYVQSAHNICLYALERAKRIVIWGHSLDVYDAELGVLLGTTHLSENRHEREYIVIDPTVMPVHRLQVYVGDAPIQHIRPSECCGCTAQ